MNPFILVLGLAYICVKRTVYVLKGVEEKLLLCLINEGIQGRKNCISRESTIKR